MKIKVFNTEIFITFTFSAFLALLLIIDRTGFLIPIFLSIVIHEFGHLITMLILKNAPKSVTLKPFHIDISGFVPKTVKEKALIASSGLIFNALFFFIFYLLYKLLNNNYLLICAAANLAVMLINALPSIGLDGGDLLFITLNIFYNKDKSMFILKIISFIIAGAIAFAAIFGLLNLKSNISMIIFAAYIFICTFFSKGEF